MNVVMGWVWCQYRIEGGGSSDKIYMLLAYRIPDEFPAHTDIRKFSLQSSDNFLPPVSISEWPNQPINPQKNTGRNTYEGAAKKSSLPTST